MKQERRTITGTVHARAIGDGMPKEIGGIAAVVNSVTDLGYFEEVITPGAFDYALSREYDIRCLFNHEAELILGRTKADTCKVFVNADGNLEYTWEVDLGDIFPLKSDNSQVRFSGSPCCIGKKLIKCTVTNDKGSDTKNIEIFILEP